MKKIYLILVTLALFCLIIRSTDAQTAFDVKQRKNNPVNTSSLQATKISAPARGSSKARTSQGRFQNARAFGFQHKEKLHNILRTEEGHPSFIETRRNTASSRVFVRKDTYTACYDYLQELAPMIQLETATENFTIRTTKSDKNNGTHIRLQQNYKGVPVYGGEVIVHLNSFGEGVAFNGRYIVPAADIDLVPSVDMQGAIRKVKTDVSKGSPIRRIPSYCSF